MRFVRFYREQKLFSELLDQEKFFVASTGLVYRWKLWGSIYMSATGTGLCLLTLLVHFDTVCLPRLWKSVFQDGSTAERNLILFFILFWAANVHICTSSLSVGESQANTFFTAWIGKCSSAGVEAFVSLCLHKLFFVTHYETWLNLEKSSFWIDCLELHGVA